jgi:hypothetical protein
MKSVQQLCARGVLCIALGIAIGFSAPGLAAEVQPSAVEVVGQPGSATEIASDTPPAPTAPPPAFESMYQDQPAQHEVAALAQMMPELMAEIKRDMHQDQTDYSVLIPIVAVLLIFGGPIVLIIVLAVLRYRTRARRERNHNENIARLLEAGRDVPLELLLGVDAPVQKVQNNLRKGIENVCVGIALLIFLTLMVGIEIGAVGLIVIAYGVSQLAVWKLIDSKAAPAESTDIAKQG